jgi:TetR/AcrR family transcriptional repressor of nem operon
VLDAAAAVFRERGYAATSLDDVIGRTEVGRASLYNAFGGKRALFLAALDRYVDAALAGALGRLGQPGSARAAIEDCLRDAVSFDLADEACGGCLLANTAVELAPHDPDIRRRVEAAFGRIEAAFRAAVERGQAQGEVDPARDPAAAAQFLLTTLMGLRLVAKARRDRDALDGAVDGAMRAL